MSARRAVRWLLPLGAAAAAIWLLASPRESTTVERDGLTFAAGPLAAALDRADVGPETRVIEAFNLGDGSPCRAFARAELSGIACRERGGWHLRLIRDGVDIGEPAGVAATDRALREAAERMRGS